MTEAAEIAALEQSSKQTKGKLLDIGANLQQQIAALEHVSRPQEPASEEPTSKRQRQDEGQAIPSAHPLRGPERDALGGHGNVPLQGQAAQMRPPEQVGGAAGTRIFLDGGAPGCGSMGTDGLGMNLSKPSGSFDDGVCCGGTCGNSGCSGMCGGCGCCSGYRGCNGPCNACGSAGCGNWGGSYGGSCSSCCGGCCQGGCRGGCGGPVCGCSCGGCAPCSGCGSCCGNCGCCPGHGGCSSCGCGACCNGCGNCSGCGCGCGGCNGCQCPGPQTQGCCDGMNSMNPMAMMMMGAAMMGQMMMAGSGESNGHSESALPKMRSKEDDDEDASGYGSSFNVNHPNYRPPDMEQKPGITDKRFVGRIKFWFETKGFGFIESEEFSKVFGSDSDVFLHHFQKRHFQRGDLVEFSVFTNFRGKPQGTELRKAKQ